MSHNAYFFSAAPRYATPKPVAAAAGSAFAAPSRAVGRKYRRDPTSGVAVAEGPLGRDARPPSALESRPSSTQVAPERTPPTTVYVVYSPHGSRPLDGVLAEALATGTSTTSATAGKDGRAHGAASGRAPATAYAMYDSRVGSQLLCVPPSSSVFFFSEGASLQGRKGRRMGVGGTMHPAASGGGSSSGLPLSAPQRVLVLQLRPFTFAAGTTTGGRGSDNNSSLRPPSIASSLSLELTVRDRVGQRRLLFSSAARAVQQHVQHTKVPFSGVRRLAAANGGAGEWVNLFLDVGALHQSCFQSDTARDRMTGNSDGGEVNARQRSTSPTARGYRLKQVRLVCTGGIGAHVRRVLALHSLPPLAHTLDSATIDNSGSAPDHIVDDGNSSLFASDVFPESLRLPQGVGSVSMFIRTGREGILLSDGDTLAAASASAPKSASRPQRERRGVPRVRERGTPHQQSQRQPQQRTTSQHDVNDVEEDSVYGTRLHSPSAVEVSALTAYDDVSDDDAFAECDGEEAACSDRELIEEQGEEIKERRSATRRPNRTPSPPTPPTFLKELPTQSKRYHQAQQQAYDTHGKKNTDGELVRTPPRMRRRGSAPPAAPAHAPTSATLSVPPSRRVDAVPLQNRLQTDLRRAVPISLLRTVMPASTAQRNAEKGTAPFANTPLGEAPVNTAGAEAGAAASAAATLKPLPESFPRFPSTVRHAEDEEANAPAAVAMAPSALKGERLGPALAVHSTAEELVALMAERVRTIQAVLRDVHAGRVITEAAMASPVPCLRQATAQKAMMGSAPVHRVHATGTAGVAGADSASPKRAATAATGWRRSLTTLSPPPPPPPPLSLPLRGGPLDIVKPSAAPNAASAVAVHSTGSSPDGSTLDAAALELWCSTEEPLVSTHGKHTATAAVKGDRGSEDDPVVTGQVFSLRGSSSRSPGGRPHRRRRRGERRQLQLQQEEKEQQASQGDQDSTPHDVDRLVLVDSIPRLGALQATRLRELAAHGLVDRSDPRTDSTGTGVSVRVGIEQTPYTPREGNVNASSLASGVRVPYYSDLLAEAPDELRMRLRTAKRLSYGGSALDSFHAVPVRPSISSQHPHDHQPATHAGSAGLDSHDLEKGDPPTAAYRTPSDRGLYHSGMHDDPSHPSFSSVFPGAAAGGAGAVVNPDSLTSARTSWTFHSSPLALTAVEETDAGSRRKSMQGDISREGEGWRDQVRPDRRATPPRSQWGNAWRPGRLGFPTCAGTATTFHPIAGLSTVEVSFAGSASTAASVLPPTAPPPAGLAWVRTPLSEAAAASAVAAAAAVVPTTTTPLVAVHPVGPLSQRQPAEDSVRVEAAAGEVGLPPPASYRTPIQTAFWQAPLPHHRWTDGTDSSLGAGGPSHAPAIQLSATDLSGRGGHCHPSLQGEAVNEAAGHRAIHDGQNHSNAIVDASVKEKEGSGSDDDQDDDLDDFFLVQPVDLAAAVAAVASRSPRYPPVPASTASSSAVGRGGQGGGGVDGGSSTMTSFSARRVADSMGNTPLGSSLRNSDPSGSKRNSSGGLYHRVHRARRRPEDHPLEALKAARVYTDRDRYVWDPVVGCYLDLRTNTFVDGTSASSAG